MYALTWLLFYFLTNCHVTGFHCAINLYCNSAMTSSNAQVQMPKKSRGKTKGSLSYAPFASSMLGWYEKYARSLPWRDKNLQNDSEHAYYVWLSEIMLQQTTVTAVIPYFLKFIERWPRVRDLANAESDEIMQAWAGLGYYSRARNLHKCAQSISEDFDGVFPQDQLSLKQLPGIGDYTSAAITSIAFNKPAVVIDGNIDRIITRLHAIKKPIREAKKEIREIANLYFGESGLLQVSEDQYPYKYRDFPQSLMDLGASICTPKSPKCHSCPVIDYCEAKKSNLQNELPTKAVRKKKPSRHGYVYWIENENGEVMIHKRPDKGLLASTHGFPTTQWNDISETIGHLDIFCSANFRKYPDSVKHVFTHFDLSLHLFQGKVSQDAVKTEEGQEFYWISRQDIEKIGLPSLFQKVLNFAIREQD